MHSTYCKLVLIFLLASTIIFSKAADTIFVRADSIILSTPAFEQAWRIHMGDDSSWAKPGYNSQGWDTLRTELPNIEDLKKDWKGICWLRTVFVIDSALRYKTIAFRVSHFGASEFYLNGKLIQRFGKPASNIKEEEIYQPNAIPFPIPLDSNLVYVLAVRYSNQMAHANPEWVKQWFGSTGFGFDIDELNNVIKKSVDNAKISFAVNFIIVGLFFSLSILYICLFLLYARRRENLFYSLFNLFISVLFASQMIEQMLHTNISTMAFFFILPNISLQLVFLCYLGFLYSIFYKNTHKIFLVFLFSAVIITVAFFIHATYSYLGYLIFAFIAASIVEGLRIIFIAIKQKKPNSWIIGSGVLLFAVFIIVVMVIAALGKNINGIYGALLFFGGLFTLPVTMSIYLARQIAVTNKNLEEQLIAVKELSLKEIEVQKKNAQLEIETEKSKAEKNDAELRAKAAELQAKAFEAERRALEAENQRKTKELEEARALQLSMLPKELPQIPNLDIAVFMKTATEVGGDYYDFRVSLDGTLTVVAGDATGHGMKAGTMVSVVKGLFNSYVHNHDILFVFREMARCIKQMNFEQLAMCMTMLKISGNKLRISAAGMPPVLIFNHANQIIEEHLIKGMPLGTMVKFPYEVKEIELNAGDTIFLMSDGFPEMLNEQGEVFGYQRVQKAFASVASNEPEEIINTLKNEEKKWTGAADPEDDITFIVIKIK